MIELENDRLNFSFPEVHPEAKLSITFQRTLRIPDDGRTYPLPPGFGNFPLRHLDDYSHRVPDSWLDRAGVLMPMYQREALWLHFSPFTSHHRDSPYPFAVKVYTGKINAVTGERFQNGLQFRKQDFLVIPGQPWLDGYCVSEGLIRQFVAMPLGEGYTVEEQLTGDAEWGGIQLIVYPMSGHEYERRFPASKYERARDGFAGMKCMQAPSAGAFDMGIGAGGRMKQEIFKDNFGPHVWEQHHRSRCFVHLLNSQAWNMVTGEAIPSTPVNAQAYKNAGFPWFDYYDENLQALGGSKILKGVKTIDQIRRSKESEWWDNDSPVPVQRVKRLNPRDLRRVNEGSFWDESI